MHAAGGYTDSHHIRTFFGARGHVDGAVDLLRFMSRRPEAAAAEEPDHNRRVVRFRQHHHNLDLQPPDQAVLRT
jgi:hypothetical protein